MKKATLITVALLVCGATFAAQVTNMTQRIVRDPRQLETTLEANATDAESRLDAIEAVSAGGGTLTSGKIIMGNGSNVGAQVTPSGDATMSNAGVINIVKFPSGTAIYTNTAASVKVTVGYFEIYQKTQLVFRCGSVTNKIDGNINAAGW